MIIEKPVIQFWEYMQSLRSELDCAVRREYTRKGITLTPSQCKIDLLYHPDTESFYVEMQNTLTTPSDYRTENLHAPHHMLESVTMAYLAERIIDQFIDQIRHRIESSFVKKTIEAQDLTPIGTYTAAANEPNALFTARFVVKTPKAWGGQGYGSLKLRVMTGGKDELIYGLVGEVQECYSDGTYGLPVQLPFIETNADGIANILHTTREWAALLRGDK